MSLSSPRSNRGNERVLVLVIDIDDDLGQAGIQTPLIGCTNVLNKAIEFAKKRPQDSDVNALFAGLAVYDKLRSLGYDAEIAVLSGVHDDWTKAMLRINMGLKELKDLLGFDEIYFVSDGVSDEQLIPIVSNYGKLIGVERVIVEQSRGIEETYILFFRYLKKAVSEKPYSKFFLGIPGLFLLSISIFTLLGLSTYIWQVILIILGMVFIVKGFGITSWFVHKWETLSIIAIMYGFSSVLIVLAGIITGFILYIDGLSITSLGKIMDYTMYLYVIGIILLFGGRLFDKLASGKAHLIWRDSLLMIPIIFLILISMRLRRVISENPAGMTPYTLFEELARSGILSMIFIAIIVTFVLSLFFVFIEKTIQQSRR